MSSPDILKISSTLGLISTTSFWSMNFTIDFLTLPVLLLGDAVPSSAPPSALSHRFLSPSTDISQVPEPFLARQWQEVFFRGHRWGPASAIISGVSFLTAAYHAESGSQQQYFYATAAVAAMSVMPWTLLVMWPDNTELHRRGNAQRGGKGSGAQKQGNGDGRSLMSILSAWTWKNNVRASMAAVATVAGIAGMFA